MQHSVYEWKINTSPKRCSGDDYRRALAETPCGQNLTAIIDLSMVEGASNALRQSFSHINMPYIADESSL